jgi:serine/threonine protein phosphatase PrpC
LSETTSHPPAAATAAPPAGPFVIERDFAGRQYVGRRERQEDYYAFSDLSDKRESTGTRILAGLGDGLGAHLGGQLASAHLVTEFIQACKRSTLSAAWRLRVALETANESLYRISSRISWDKGAPMGSTFLGLSVSKSSVHWVSVGDSPLLIHREGKLTRLNADHSLAPILDERARLGELTEEEARVHPDRHVLQSACMGLPLTLVDARMDPYPLQTGDIIIAASDGLFTLDMAQMEDMLSFGKHTSAGKIADALIFAVRCADHPRQDNTTVCVLKVP